MPTMDQNNLVSPTDFYSADAEALRIRYKQIEHLIGLSHHSASEGTYCEALLREFLRRTLPHRVSVDTGFIRRISDADWSQNNPPPLPADAPIATPQLDIIIHDTHDYAPLFRSEDFVVVLPEAVRGVIEVKKQLDWNGLKDAVANITEMTHLLRRWRFQANLIFTGVFAFSLGGDLAPESKLISDSFKNCYQKRLDSYQGDCELPNLLMALPRFALHRSSNPNGFDYCPTAPEDRETPNVAGQFLVFLLSRYTSQGTQGRALEYPQFMKDRRTQAFTVTGRK
jgi:hypothetical protein